MKLIADSGSTKTDWRIIDAQKINKFQTKGLNPYFVDEAEIEQELLIHGKGMYFDKVAHIYFYGAGCGTEQQQKIIENGLCKVFPKARIEVANDMLAAARSACGTTDGIVCILGTGSNSCLYQESQIVSSSPSNGIWLGDEGSAGYLGKRLITDYLNNDLPDSAKMAFEKRFSDRRAEILDHVYKQPSPNTYLASFSRFIARHLTDPYFMHIVYEAFEEFLQKTVLKYENYKSLPIHFVGGVAHHYKKVLRQVVKDRGITAHQILKSPIEGLVKYHLEEG